MALTLAGVTGFTQSGPERWAIDSSGLDTVVVPYRGFVTGLSDFIASKPKWSAYPGDPTNMFLESIITDDDKRQPTAYCRYIGAKAGVLPLPLDDTGEIVQQVSYAPFVGTGNLVLTYIGPTSRKKTVTRTRPTSSIGAITPATIDPDHVIWWVWTGPSFTNNTAYFVLSLFQQRMVTTQITREIVPGKYYENIEDKLQLLFSTQA